MKELTKTNVMESLLEVARSRDMSKADLKRKLGTHDRSLERDAGRLPGDRRSIGWLTLIAWAGRLGYRIEFQIMPIADRSKTAEQEARA